jgi:molybdate transport system permease protein
MNVSWDPLYLTFKLALITNLFLLIIGIPLGYWLTYSSSKSKYIIQALVSMPLVLPPTVLGFYLLVVFNPGNFLGKLLKSVFDLQLVFTFEGLVVASIIYSLPFMVNPIQTGFQSLSASLSEASYTLGKSKMSTIFKVLLPNMKPSLISGIVISFAHTIGEFGVILMIGGSIPGETRVASIAIYDEVEALNYDTANFYALILFVITFLILLSVYLFNRKYLKAF